MLAKLWKPSRILVSLLLTLHVAVALYSYYVPRSVVIVSLAAVFCFLIFTRKYDAKRIMEELLFASCVINIPFGAGGYLYKPWTGPAALALCVLPSLGFRWIRKPWWPAFRRAFIVLITGGLLFSAAMRSDAGFNRCASSRSSAGQSALETIPSRNNPYGVYALPGGCPVFACYGMNGSLAAVDCSGKATFIPTEGNPQRMALNVAGNRAYFPVRGTGDIIEASISPFKIVRTVRVPGGKSLLNADVYLKDGRIAVVDERVHDLFVLSAETLELEFRVPLGWGAAYSVAVDQASGVAFVTDWAGAFLHRIDLETRSASKRYIGPSAFSVKSAGGLVYAARPFRGKVAVFDSGSMDFVKFIDAGYGVRDIAPDPIRNTLVSGNYFDGTVSVSDLSSGKKTGHFDVGPLVRGVSVDPESGDIYVAWTCGVSVIRRQ